MRRSRSKVELTGHRRKRGNEMAKVKFFKVTNAVANDTSKLPIVDGQFIFAYDRIKINKT